MCYVSNHAEQASMTTKAHMCIASTINCLTTIFNGYPAVHLSCEQLPSGDIVVDSTRVLTTVTKSCIAKLYKELKTIDKQ